MQNSYRWKSSAISNVKYTPRVPLIFLTMEKIKCENFDFVVVFFSVFFSFPSCITQKLHSIYKQSAHQITAVLSEIFLSLVSGMQAKISELWLQTLIAGSFRDDILSVLTHTTWKLKVIKGHYLLKDCSTIRYIYFLGYSCVQNMTAEL